MAPSGGSLLVRIFASYQFKLDLWFLTGFQPIVTFVLRLVTVSEHFWWLTWNVLPAHHNVHLSSVIKIWAYLTRLRAEKPKVILRYYFEFSLDRCCRSAQNRNKNEPGATYLKTRGNGLIIVVWCTLIWPLLWTWIFTWTLLQGRPMSPETIFIPVSGIW